MGWFRDLRAAWALKERFDNLEDAFTGVQRQLLDVQSDMDWLGLEVKKLRGKITGGLRTAAQDGAQSPDVAVDDLNTAIREGRYGLPRNPR